MKRLLGSLFGAREESPVVPGLAAQPAAGPAGTEAGREGPETASAPSAASSSSLAVAPSPAQRPANSIQCPWCSAYVPPDSSRCPRCGAGLIEDPRPREGIPGVTTISAELMDYQRRTASAAEKKRKPTLRSILPGQPDPMFADSADGPVDGRVLAPPSAEVRAAMQRLDQEIAAGGIVDPRAGATTGSGAAPAPATGDTESARQ